MTLSHCPVCLNANNARAEIRNGNGGYGVNCDNCGRFSISEDAYEDFLDTRFDSGQRVTPVQRARLSHRIRSGQTKGQRVRVEADFVDRFVKDSFPGPNPSQQMVNLIRFVGDELNRKGSQLPNLPNSLFALIGAPSPEFAGELTLELIQRGLLTGVENRLLNGPPGALRVGLTLDGWSLYEKERAGQFSGRTGFIAMKFGDAILDPFIRDVVKPAIKGRLGYDLIDLRDVSRAGVIDNIMRAQIRDSAFILVDLTHDNSGAYWEAGYAEGLGKPVVYLCEQSKFESAKTHFDTNHCTTVIWSSDDPKQFCNELVATLRRSLNLFADASEQ